MPPETPPSSGQRAQANELFEAALAHAPEKWEDFLTQAPAPPEVVAEVRSLLDHHAREVAEGRLDALPAELRSVFADALDEILGQPELPPETVLGVRFVIRGLVARGG